MQKRSPYSIAQSAIKKAKEKLSRVEEQIREIHIPKANTRGLKIALKALKKARVIKTHESVSHKVPSFFRKDPD